jgi:hypothetical protein
MAEIQKRKVYVEVNFKWVYIGDTEIVLRENEEVEKVISFTPIQGTESHVTKNNPNGEVRQCDRRDIHFAHEWQAEFGAYFDVYCPGNDGKKA